jgi:genetic interactor of prohibitins 3, mitochondrial
VRPSRCTIILSFRAKRTPVKKDGEVCDDLATASEYVTSFREIMSRSLRLVERVVRRAGIPVADLPVFLCPGILQLPALPTTPRCKTHRRSRFQTSQQRFTASLAAVSTVVPPKVLAPLLEKLPQQCPGCGALSQTADMNAAGFYTPTRKSIRTYLEGVSFSRKSAEDEIVTAALENAASIETGISVGQFSDPSKNPPFRKKTL